VRGAPAHRGATVRRRRRGRHPDCRAPPAPIPPRDPRRGARRRVPSGRRPRSQAGRRRPQRLARRRPPWPARRRPPSPAPPRRRRCRRPDRVPRSSRSAHHPTPVGRTRSPGPHRPRVRARGRAGPPWPPWVRGGRPRAGQRRAAVPGAAGRRGADGAWNAWRVSAWLGRPSADGGRRAGRSRHSLPSDRPGTWPGRRPCSGPRIGAPQVTGEPVEQPKVVGLPRSVCPAAPGRQRFALDR
jgi:serine/arginine repetitive matrix protein 1